MTIRRLFFVFVHAFLLCSYAVAAEKADLKSGPQAGDSLPGPFQALVAYSDQASLVGTRNDYTEMYGPNPVVLVFAREMTKSLTKLVNQLDAEAAKHKSARLGIVVVFLSDDYALERKLKEHGEKQGIKHVNLAIMKPDGAKLYKLSKEAEVTVLLYKRRKVEANHAFKKGELGAAGRESILDDVPKIASKQ
jgi:hypothetical protein